MRKALVSSFVLFAALLGVAPGLSGAEPPGDEEILALAARGVERREFHQAIEARFSAEQLTGGDAHVSKGPDFLFVFRSDAEPELEIDDAPAGRLTQAGHGLWVLRTGLRTGSSHAIQYFVDGKPAGRRVDVRTYSPLHYSQAGSRTSGSMSRPAARRRLRAR